MNSKIIKYPVLVVGIIALVGCATTKPVTSAADVYADDDSNVVFIGYEISVDLENVVDLHLNCIDQTTDELHTCFHIPFNKDAPIQRGAIPARMEFGSYKLVELIKRKLVGKTPVNSCKTVNGKPYCKTYYYNNYESYPIEVEPSLTFSVSSDNAPYPGRFATISMPSGIKVIEASDEYDADLRLIDDKELRSALTMHLNQ